MMNKIKLISIASLLLIIFCVNSICLGVNIEKVIECDTNSEAIKEINGIKKENDCILLKASNGMKFGEILEGIND